MAGTGTPGRAILAGFVATLAMTMLVYAAPSMGMPPMDIAAMLGSMVRGGQMPAALTGAWFVGMAIHLMMGTVAFSLIYAYVVSGLLPGAAWVRGALWGAALWMLMMVAALPMMGMGVLASNTPRPLLFVMGALMGHLIYGAILGVVAGPQPHRALPQSGLAGHGRAG